MLAKSVLVHIPGALPMLRVDTIAMILNFFAEVCAEGHMRDWLGSPEGSVFWLPLLSLLCNKSSSVDSDLEGHSRYSSHFYIYSTITGILLRKLRFIGRWIAHHFVHTVRTFHCFLQPSIGENGKLLFKNIAQCYQHWLQGQPWSCAATYLLADVLINTGISSLMLGVSSQVNHSLLWSLLQ